MQCAHPQPETGATQRKTPDAGMEGFRKRPYSLQGPVLGRDFVLKNECENLSQHCYWRQLDRKVRFRPCV